MADSIPISESGALTPKEAAAYTGIGEDTIRRLVFLAKSGAGDLPCFFVGTSTKIPRAAFDEWLARAGREHRQLREPAAVPAEPAPPAAPTPPRRTPPTPQPRRKPGRPRRNAYEKIKALD